MDISLQGFGQKTATFSTTTADLVVGEPVIMASNNTVKRATLGKLLVGVVTSICGDYVSVALKGAVTVPYSDSAPTLGVCSLSCDGDGGVEVDLEPLIYYRVLEVDSTNNTVTFLL
ncbi:MAG: hypothetical protein R3Y27_00470 [Clostridia bacterium]